jgi:tetratricopeptide (TPR) repeat protein
MAGEHRVFLSAVSSEFKELRRALRHDLATAGYDVHLQEELQLRKGETLLGVLDQHLKECQGVVCLIGARCGAGFPTETEVEPYREHLPAGMPRASYTQWEFLLSRAHGVRPLVFCPRDTLKPEVPDEDLDEPDDSALQATFKWHITEVGVPRTLFGDIHELGRMVLRQLPPVGPRNKPIILPYPSLGTLFKGRDTFLRTLRASLQKSGAAAIAGRAIHGLGGVGKTRAAVEYAWKHQADYTALALLDAETPDRLRDSLAALTGPLRLAEHAATETDAKAEAVIRWLRTNPGWFLILDNLDTKAALDEAHRLLGRLSGGHVVLTSRLGVFPRGIERLELDELSLDDAAAFLLEATDAGRVRASDDEAQARALAQDLGQLALALEMAAATIEARRLRFSAYRTLWAGNRARVIGWSDQKITGYHHAVAETWRTSVDQLTEAGRALLERLAFLAPEPIPVSLVADEAALDDLTTYSLATRDPGGETFLVHRLVQVATRRDLEREGRDEARLTEALEWVNDAFVGNPLDVRSWKTLDPLAPHAETVVGFADAAGIVRPTARLMNELGQLFNGKSLVARAEPLTRRVVSIFEASDGKDHPNVAGALNNLAALLLTTNRLAQAEPLMRRALAISEASYGKDHPSVATRLNNLARLLQDTNRLAEAEPLMRRALAIDEASYGEYHPSVAIRLSNFATLLQDTNRLAEAEPLMRRALAIVEASYGEDHPSVAIRLNNLATLLQATNRLAEAEPLIRRALAIDEASYGQDHPEVATDLNNLALLLYATNRLAETEPLMRRVVSIFLQFQRDTGHLHPQLQSVLVVVAKEVVPSDC